MNTAVGLGFGLFAVIFYLALLGVSIYCLVLFIKLAHRGIKALDIYIEKNNREQIQRRDFNPQ